MNAYIVMQGKTYQQEKDAGIIWSHKLDQAGNLQHSWERMRDVKQGDLVFHYVNGWIAAVSSVKANCVESPMPSCLQDQFPQNTAGYLVELEYHSLDVPLPIADHLEEIVPFFPVKYSAFQTNGQGNQGYLYPCNDELTLVLFELISKTNIFMQDEEQLSLSIDSIVIQNKHALVPFIALTESKIKTKQRTGQTIFSEAIGSIWNHACPICGISLNDLLRATYAKPWKDCSEEERLDPYNGILLCCNHHALYEKGYITFTAKGNIRISEKIAEQDHDHFFLNKAIHIPTAPEHKNYFNWHKKHIFKG